MPVLKTLDFDTGYEGAIVLDPKCALYTDPVAVCDYKSLYPSSMISENICSSSKVWTKEYDLAGNLLKETGVQRNGVYIYDNLPNYKYVDIEYDTFHYVRKTPKSKAVKTKMGTKMCRFAQFPNGKAIFPCVLDELLQARSRTRKQMAKENLEKKVDKTEIPEATFMMLLLKTAQMYERFADENYANLKDAKNLLSLGYTVTFYKQGGKLSYEAKPPEKIGFKP
jgi:DNA polymerase elongation subunit (family B)